MDTVIDTIKKLRANAGMLNEQPMIAAIARTEMLRLVDVLKTQLESGVKKQVHSTVVRATRSPLNKLKWSCDLECGHEVWVTSKSKPRTAECNVCVSSI